MCPQGICRICQKEFLRVGAHSPQGSVMNPKAAFRLAILVIALAWQSGSARAQGTFLTSFDEQIQAAGGQAKDQKLDKGQPAPDMIKPKQPDLPAPAPQPSPPAQQPSPYDFASALGLGLQNDGVSNYNPHMMGDFGVWFARQLISVSSLQTITTTTTTTTFVGTDPPKPVVTTTTTTKTVPVTTSRVVFAPVPGLGAFNVAENESPRPTDRVFGFYNFFGDIRGPDIGSGVPILRSTTSTVVVGNTSTTVQTNTVTPGVQPRVSLDREVFGFEKTFFDGFASVEVRLPLLQQQGGGFNEYDVGDVTLVGKYAFILDRTTGDVLSGGLALTLPSGPTIVTTAGNIRTTLIQPWFGYIWNFDRFFVQGIHSIVVPTDAEVPVLMFNDLGLNYWLYRGSQNQFLSQVVPVLEAHVTTPLNHRDNSDPLFLPDTVILTAGVHFGLYRSGLLTLGAAVPVTGPTPFSVEAFAQFNWYF
jgi:hypothetical protein